MDKQENYSNPLKDINFLSWRVGRKKQEQKLDHIHKVLSERPRQRHITKH